MSASSGLSDVLRDLAENPRANYPHEPEEPLPAGHRPGTPHEQPPPQREAIDSMAELPRHEHTRPPGSRTPEPIHPARRRTALPTSVAPLCITLGVLLAGVGVWGVLVLTGVLVNDDPQVRGMALPMTLLSWPIALTLTGAGVYYLVQHWRR